MRYLIDGYNLLHAMGVLARRTGPGGLEKARLRLLGLLSGTYGDQAREVTVVFDAARAPPDVPGETEYQGLQVHFARGQEADDWIEETIRRCSAPGSLTVVSDDHRIQRAARRRRCRALNCNDYLEELERRRRPRHRAPEEARQEKDNFSKDHQYWLREFADLADDPAWRELADPPEFFQFREEKDS
jgi:predicted RNA-binding protein with PIN domain